MHATVPPAISQLLIRWREGDHDALRALVPLLYDDLRRIAHQNLRRACPGHTLQTTALVHEAYMRLETQHAPQFQNRNHFVAVCALLMRQILTGYERTHRAAKRGGGAMAITLDDAGVASKARAVDLIALDDVSTKDQDCQNQILQLRQFAATQGWAVVGEYQDEVSGSTSDRPQFRAMFEAASRRQFNVLLFWSLDRLSREGVLDTLQHLNRLTGYGVAWRSFSELYLDSTAARISSSFMVGGPPKSLVHKGN